MRRARMFFIFGIWIAVLPYLGFPYTLKNVLFSISGVLLTGMGYLMYRESKTGEKKAKTFDNFSENHDFVEVEIKSERLEN